MAALEHSFVSSHIDYCNAAYVYVMSPQTITNRLQRVMNAAAQLSMTLVNSVIVD